MCRTYLKSFLFASLTIPLLNFAEENSNIEVGGRKQNPMPTSIEAQANYFAEYPPVYYTRGVHGLAAVAISGESVEFEDGSVWKVSAYDAHKVKHFQMQDPLIVTQNHRWFSRYQYRIINQVTGASLEANLYLGPIKEGIYTNYICEIDQYRGEVYLTDNSRWKVSIYDAALLEKWVLNDPIIIGQNSGWDSACQGLLINVETGNYIRAEQF